MMSTMALKLLNHCGRRAQRLTAYNLLRMGSTDEPCSSKPPEPCKSSEPPKQQEPCPPKQAEPCPPKPEPCPPMPKATVCSEVPPCPPLPRTVQTICPPGSGLDRNNPCNYCPPACIDPDYPDLRRLKKLQCLFQQDDGLVLYLKRGNIDAFFYQFTIVTVFVSTAAALYSTFGLILKH